MSDEWINPRKVVTNNTAYQLALMEMMFTNIIEDTEISRLLLEITIQ